MEYDELLKRIGDALGECADNFASIRGDWSDPRTECRAGDAAVAEGEKALEELRAMLAARKPQEAK